MVGVSYSDKTRLKKGAWSPEEDRKLVAFIRRNGLCNWRELPKHAGLLRCGKSCRLRWMNYLRPNIKKGKYSREEEEIIINLHQSLGNKWAAIAAKLPGRTDNDIKNHWHTNLKKLLKHIPTKSEATLHYKKITDFEDSSKRELEPNTFPPTDQTFRSSPLPPPPSSGVFSSLSTDENTVASEKLVELNGNFWTDPVLAGNSYIQDDFVDTLVDPGLLFPLSPISLGEPLFTYDSYNDDGFGWFN